MASMMRLSLTSTPVAVDIPPDVDQVTVYAEGGAMRISYASSEGDAKLRYRPIPIDAESVCEVAGLRRCGNRLWLWALQACDCVVTWETVGRKVRQ